MTKETILENNLREFAEIGMGTFDKERYDADVSTGQIEPFYKSMDEYAKEVAIDFCLHVCGQLKWPENKMGYDENSNEHTLLLLPATIDKRFDLYLKEKQITND